MRQLLCESLGLDASQSWLPQPYEMTWRGSKRSCEILFRNVREMNPEEFRNTAGLWRIVIDWPFDEAQHTPLDDLAQVRNFTARGEPADTIVWLPWFFTDATKRDLGRLVLLDQVLTGNRLNEYGAHLSQTERDQARSLMANQRDQMRTRIRNCLLAAYGISKADTDSVDDSHDLEGHFISLDPALSPRPPVAANIGEAVQDVFGQALAARFPDHPEFEVEVRRPGLRRVLEVVERAAANADARAEVDRQARNEVRHIAVPLRLGDMGEMHFKLERRWQDELERKHARHGGETLSVRELRGWIEAPERRGLDRDVQNLLILTFTTLVFPMALPMPEPSSAGAWIQVRQRGSRRCGSRSRKRLDRGSEKPRVAWVHCWPAESRPVTQASCCPSASYATCCSAMKATL